MRTLLSAPTIRLLVIASALCVATTSAFGGGTTPNAPTESTSETKPGPKTADPVGVVDGAVYDSAVDLRVPCPDVDLVLKRAYGTWSTRTGGLGYGWSHSYEWTLVPDGTNLVLYADADPESAGAGETHRFVRPADGGVSVSPSGRFTLRAHGDGWEVRTPGARRCRFDAAGRLVEIASPGGTRVRLERRSSGGRLERVVHDCGQSLVFAYDSAGRLTAVETDAPGVRVDYSYASLYGWPLLERVVRTDGLRAATNAYEWVESPDGGMRLCLPSGLSSYRLPEWRPGARTSLELARAVARRVSEAYLEPSFSSAVSAGSAAVYYQPRPVRIPTPAPIPKLKSGWPPWCLICGSPPPVLHRPPVLRAKTDANGVVTRYEYESPSDGAAVRCVRTWATGGLLETHLAHLDGAAVVMRPIAGQTAMEVFVQDDSSRNVLRAMGDETDTREYDAAGNVAREVVTNAATGAFIVRAFEYDVLRNPVREASALGCEPNAAVEREWDDFFGIPRRTVSPAGRVREWATNGFDVVVRGAGANDPRLVTTVHCSTNWRPMSAELPNGGRVLWERDAAGRVVRVARDGLPDARYSYDALGRVATETRPGPDGPRATSYVRNARGRPLSVVRPDGTSEAFAYDGAGTRAVAHVDALGRTDVFEWVLGLPVHAGRVGADGATSRLWSVAHDPQLNVVSVTDPLGRRAETYVLDANERVVAATNLEGQALLRSYLVGDLVAAETRFDGTEVSCGYDSGGRLASADYPDAEVRLAWDADGLLLSASDAAGTVTNVRDAATSWLVLSRGVDGTDVRYAYSDGGAATSVVSAAGTIAHTLDAAGRRTRSASPAGTVSFARCPWSGLVSAATNANGLAAAFSRDAMERVTNVAWTAADGSPLGGMSCVRDALGRVVSRRVRMGDAVFDRAFAYDGLDRLAADGPVSYEYDAAGNRLSARGGAEGDVAYEYAPGDRLSSWTGGSCEWDAAGCATRIAHAGRPVLGLLWDGRRRLVSVSTNGVPAESYSYDALGRRVSTTTAEGTVRHVYDDRWQCLADFAGDGAVLRAYLWDEGVDRLLAVRAGGREYAALTDAQGTVWGFSDGTDVVARWTYDAWGNVLSEEIAPSASALAGTRHRFHGRELSAATGLVHFRARWYDPLVGRWISKDPIRLHGGLNLYAFCADDPVNFTDRFGLCKKKTEEEEGEEATDPGIPIDLEIGALEVSKAVLPEGGFDVAGKAVASTAIGMTKTAVQAARGASNASLLGAVVGRVNETMSLLSPGIESDEANKVIEQNEAEIRKISNALGNVKEVE